MNKVVILLRVLSEIPSLFFTSTNLKRVFISLAGVGAHEYYTFLKIAKAKKATTTSRGGTTTSRETVPASAPLTGDWIWANASAYCACVKCCGKTNGITASGTKATANRTIAAPSTFAFGTQVVINGQTYTVEDRGGAIKVENGVYKIDLLMSTKEECLNFGRRKGKAIIGVETTTTTTTTKPSGGYAYYEDGKLTLNNYSYEGKGFLNGSNNHNVIVYAEHDLTLELIGNNTLTQTYYYSDMIYVDDAKLKRAGLDYWHLLDITYYENLDDFFEKNPNGKYFFFTTNSLLIAFLFVKLSVTPVGEQHGVHHLVEAVGNAVTAVENMTISSEKPSSLHMTNTIAGIRISLQSENR